MLKNLASHSYNYWMDDIILLMLLIVISSMSAANLIVFNPVLATEITSEFYDDKQSNSDGNMNVDRLTLSNLALKELIQHEYSDNVIANKDRDDGIGLFANKDIEKGDIIFNISFSHFICSYDPTDDDPKSLHAIIIDIAVCLIAYRYSLEDLDDIGLRYFISSLPWQSPPDIPALFWSGKEIEMFEEWTSTYNTITIFKQSLSSILEINEIKLSEEMKAAIAIAISRVHVIWKHNNFGDLVKAYSIAPVADFINTSLEKGKINAICEEKVVKDFPILSCSALASIKAGDELLTSYGEVGGSYGNDLLLLNYGIYPQISLPICILSNITTPPMNSFKDVVGIVQMFHSTIQQDINQLLTHMLPTRESAAALIRLEEKISTMRKALSLCGYEPIQRDILIVAEFLL